MTIIIKNKYRLGIIKYILTSVLVFVLFFNCSSDDHPRDKLKADLIGKWVSTTVVINDVQSERDCPYSQITFREDDSFQEDYIEFSEFHQECRISSGAIGAWGISDGEQSVFLTNSVFTNTAELIDDQLIRKRAIFNPVTSTSDELVITFIRGEF